MMTTPYMDHEGIHYSHPELSPDWATADLIIYRVHPNHGVAIVKPGSSDQLVLSHVTYVNGEEQDALNMDDSPSLETMHTNVASDVTAFIDAVAEQYLHPVKLSELMRDQIDPYDF